MNRSVYGLLIPAALFTGLLQATIVFETAPTVLPPNLSSLGYQATRTAEFGDLIDFAGTERSLTNVVVTMSDWALASTYGSASPTWNHPLTLTLYNVNNSGAIPMPGSVIASQTNVYAIPWRPEADPSCTGGRWLAGNGNCYGGLAFNVVFDLTGTLVPNQIIYGLSYNTQSAGVSPIGTDGHTIR